MDASGYDKSDKSGVTNAAARCITCGGPLALGYDAGMCDPCAAAFDADKKPTAKAAKPVHGGHPPPFGKR